MSKKQIEEIFKNIATLGRGIYLSRQKIFKEIGLSSAQSELIFQLYNEGTLEMGEISERLFITKGGVTQIVDVLVENELIERIQTIEDRRKWYVKLTDKAFNVISQLHDLEKDSLYHVFSNVSSEDLELINKVLNNAKESLYKFKHNS